MDGYKAGPSTLCWEIVVITWLRCANSHFLRLRLQFQQPVRVRTCLARGVRRVCAGRGSRARRFPPRGEAEALSSVIVTCGTGLVPPGCSLWRDCQVGGGFESLPPIVCNDSAGPVTESRVRCVTVTSALSR